MHTLERWRQPHDFAPDHRHAETRTRYVIGLTAAMMGVEIAAGLAFGSMALLADGWHMATHVVAFGVALFAYRYARAHAANPRFTFGTGKVSVLGGFASAVVLGMIALVMAVESFARFFDPHAIRFDEALGIAVLGLVVNLASGAILHGQAGHEHGAHEHGEGHAHHHAHDHNLRAAYFHVLADALTSVLAIVALGAGKLWGVAWLDPAMGIVGAAVIGWWVRGLLRDSARILLDSAGTGETRHAIEAVLAREPDNLIADLHVWHVGPQKISATLSVVTHHPRTPEDYKRLLAGIPLLAHVVVEVNRCEEAGCEAVAGKPR